MTHATTLTCSTCGKATEITAESRDLLGESVIAAGWQMQPRTRCPSCVQGETPFEDLVRFAVVQWLGKRGTAYSTVIARVTEPQNASFAVITTRDDRSDRVFRPGQSGRSIEDEVHRVMSALFPAIADGAHAADAE